MIIDMSESTAAVQIHEARVEKFVKVYAYFCKYFLEHRRKNDRNYHLLLCQLHNRKIISTNTLLEEMCLDYDEYMARLREVQLDAS